jgi:hypothetical protein
MFWTLKFWFVVDILLFLGLKIGLLFEKLGNFFSNLLVTLPSLARKC